MDLRQFQVSSVQGLDRLD